MKDVADKSPPPKLPGAKILLVVSPYYRGVADMMQRGAEAAAEQAEATLDRIFVPGAFEIPAAIAHAAKAGQYDGFVALGCVVRGETSHYDYVCGESARGLMDLTIREGLSIGYGILTVNTLAQAEGVAAAYNAYAAEDALIVTGTSAVPLARSR